MKRQLTFLFSLSFLFATGCLADELSRGEPADTSADDESLLAQITVPTDDGRAAYHFRFAEIDGVVATMIDSPIGYPAVDVPDECALRTFLRVADPDAIVPTALLRDCDPESAASGDDAVKHVADLKTPDLTLAYAATAYCSHAAFDDRIDELKALAAYIPMTQSCTFVCDLKVIWNEHGCVYVDENDHWVGNCTASDVQYFGSIAPEGEYCAHKRLECTPIPNTECSHTWTVRDHWGPWSAWAWQSGSHTTKTRTEISSCTSTGTTAYWQARKPGEAWSEKHYVSYPGNSVGTITLYAGSSNDHYRGWTFYHHASGNSLHVAYSAVEMEGKNRLVCPIKI